MFKHCHHEVRMYCTSQDMQCFVCFIKSAFLLHHKSIQSRQHCSRAHTRAHSHTHTQSHAKPKMSDRQKKEAAKDELVEIFLILKDDADQKSALCQQCLTVIASTRGNTMNLFDHPSHHHRELYDACRAKTQTLRHK